MDEIIKYNSEIIPHDLIIPDQPRGPQDHKYEYETYRGVHYLMRSWFLPYLGKCFAYYIYVPVEYLPLSESIDDAHSKGYDNEDNHIKLQDKFISSEIDDWDFHGGITWLACHSIDTLEIGCDYQKLRSRNENKDFNCIRSDVYDTIDSVLKWLEKHKKN